VACCLISALLFLVEVNAFFTLKQQWGKKTGAKIPNNEGMIVVKQNINIKLKIQCLCLHVLRYYMKNQFSSFLDNLKSYLKALSTLFM
jgi:hypothetical protein